MQRGADELSLKADPQHVGTPAPGAICLKLRAPLRCLGFLPASVTPREQPWVSPFIKQRDTHAVFLKGVLQGGPQALAESAGGHTVSTKTNRHSHPGVASLRRCVAMELRLGDEITACVVLSQGLPTNPSQGPL